MYEVRSLFAVNGAAKGDFRKGSVIQYEDAENCLSARRRIENGAIIGFYCWLLVYSDS